MSGADSPRTAEKIAKARAFKMLTDADEQVRAMQMDKTWSKRYGEFEAKREQREASHREKIVARQREVAANLEQRQRELAEEEEEARAEMVLRLSEMSRQEEELKLSARGVADRAHQQYVQHLEATKKRTDLLRANEDTARVKFQQQQEALRAAAKRLEAQKREQAQAASERNKAFQERRQGIFDKRKQELAKREQERKEYHKREAALVQRAQENERMKQAELAAKAAQSAEAMLSTTGSLLGMLTAKHEERMEHWNHEMEETNARIAELHESRTRHAREHAMLHSERRVKHAEVKRTQDTIKEDELVAKTAEKQTRLNELSSARTSRQRRLEKDLRDEFELKSNINALQWKVSIDNSSPDKVRSGLGSIRAPIPAISPR